VVVHDFDFFSARGRPAEADAVLIIDTDTVLTRSASLERLEAIARRHAEVGQASRDLQLPQLASGDSLDAGEPLDPPPLRQSLGLDIAERHDHEEIITRRVINVKRVYRDAPIRLSRDVLQPGCLTPT